MFEAQSFSNGQAKNGNSTLTKVDIAAYVYLLIPFILFIWGWVHISISLPVISLIIISLIKLSHQSSSEYILSKFRTYFREVLPALVIFISYLFLAGITGNWAQHPDFYVRNDIFWDLTTKPWPPELPDGRYFVYYCHSYLPASLIGGVFGWKTAQWAYYIWSCIGILFTIYYLYKAVGNYSFWIACIFFVWHGLEFLPCTFANVLFPDTLTNKLDSYIHLSEPPMFSIKALLHCFIPISIIGGMLFQKNITQKLAPSLGILAVMYNPMGSIFLLPILIYLFSRQFFTNLKDIKSIEKWNLFIKNALSLQNIILLIPFFIILVPFYASTNSISTGNIKELININNLTQFVYFLFFNIIIVSFLIRKNIKDKLLWVILTVHILSCLSGIIVHSDIGKKGSFVTTYFFIILYCQSFLAEKTAPKKYFIIYSIVGTSYFVYWTGAMAATIAGIGTWLLLKMKLKHITSTILLTGNVLALTVIFKPNYFEPIKKKLSGEYVRYHPQRGIYQSDGGSGLWWWYRTFPQKKDMPIWFK